MTTIEGKSVTEVIVETLIKDIQHDLAPVLAARKLFSSGIQEPNRKKSKRRTYNLKEVQ